MKNSLTNLISLYPEVDYQALMTQMPEQSHPRRKLKEMQRKGQLLRLKKGFYVLTKSFIGKDYSPQIVANLLYGPSYISLESALSFYGLIPERVERFTNVTSQKNKTFETPIGDFTYRHLHRSLYPLGVTIKKTMDDRFFLIATPEKALLDILTLNFKNLDRPRARDIPRVLEDDLRIDLHELKKQLSRHQLQELNPHYRNRPWSKLLIQFLLEDL